MTRYGYVFPFITIGPNRRLSLTSAIMPQALAEALGHSNATLEIRRLTILRATILEERRELAHFHAGGWENAAALTHRVPSDADFDWQQPDGIPYVETHITVLEGAGFLSPFPPAFYSVYYGSDAKTILSDNNLKYGDDRLATQFRVFRRLVVGYPACFVDPERDIGESLLLINPYLTQAIVFVELEGIATRRRLVVSPQQVYRVPLSDLLPEGMRCWQGAVSIDSKVRPSVYFLKHAHCDANVVSTLEHPSYYYANDSFVPATQRARLLFGRHVLKPLRIRLKRGLSAFST